MADPTAARLEREFKLARPLIGCRFDPSGRFLFVSSEDDSIQRIDLLSDEKTPLVGHKSWVRGMAFVGASRSAAKEIAEWERERAAIQALTGFGAGVVPLPPAEPFTLVSGDYHGKLVWWQGDAPGPKPLRTVEAHTGWIRAVAASPDGSTIASCGNDNTVKIWNAADGKLLRSLEGHTSHVYNVAFPPDGTRLASCDLKGVVKDWNLRTGTAERELDAKALWKYDPTFMADIGGARGMVFSQDGTKLACAGITNVSNAFAGVGNPAVILFDWKDGKSKLLKTKDAFQGTAWGVAFHPDGFLMAAGGGSGGGAWFWKDDPTSIHFLKLPVGARDMALAPAGSRFACAGANGTAYLYTFTPGPAPAKPEPKKSAPKKK